MFWDIFVRLCQAKGVSPNAVARFVGVKSTGTVSAWKKGTLPRDGVLAMIADYFNVTTDYLLGLVPESYLFGTEQRLENLLAEYEKETDEIKKQELAAQIDGFRESLEDQRVAMILAESKNKKAPTEDGGRFEDGFTLAAHQYAGRLSEKDKKIILQLMATLAGDVEEAESERHSDGNLLGAIR